MMNWNYLVIACDQCALHKSNQQDGLFVIAILGLTIPIERTSDADICVANSFALLVCSSRVLHVVSHK